MIARHAAQRQRCAPAFPRYRASAMPTQFASRHRFTAARDAHTAAAANMLFHDNKPRGHRLSASVVYASTDEPRAARIMMPGRLTAGSPSYEPHVAMPFPLMYIAAHTEGSATLGRTAILREGREARRMPCQRWLPPAAYAPAGTAASATVSASAMRARRPAPEMFVSWCLLASGRWRRAPGAESSAMALLAANAISAAEALRRP